MLDFSNHISHLVNVNPQLMHTKLLFYYNNTLNFSLTSRYERSIVTFSLTAVTMYIEEKCM